MMRAGTLGSAVLAMFAVVACHSRDEAADSSDYGWGKGKQRPVYPCTGRPQGLFRAKNRSTGFASTAAKYASTFALAARIHAGGNDSRVVTWPRRG